MAIVAKITTKTAKTTQTTKTTRVFGLALMPRGAGGHNCAANALLAQSPKSAINVTPASQPMANLAL